MSVLARNPHKGPGGEISRETRNGGGKKGPREGRERERESQLSKLGRIDQSACDSSPEKDTVGRRRL